MFLICFIFFDDWRGILLVGFVDVEYVVNENGIDVVILEWIINFCLFMWILIMFNVNYFLIFV